MVVVVADIEQFVVVLVLEGKQMKNISVNVNVLRMTKMMMEEMSLLLFLDPVAYIVG